MGGIQSYNEESRQLNPEKIGSTLTHIKLFLEKITKGLKLAQNPLRIALILQRF